MSSDPGRAAVSWQKPEAHLREASAQDADASPMAVIHSSYFGMFHAVGRAPNRHDEVIQQFGRLVRDMDDALRAAGKAFNVVKDERTAADFDETMVPSPDEAREALLATRNFLALCGAKHGLRSSAP